MYSSTPHPIGSSRSSSIGIFALQGAFIEHQIMLDDLGCDTFQIRSMDDVKRNKIDGVVLPGGESTTMMKILKKTGLDKWLIKNIKGGLPIFGTCAGTIILSQSHLKLMDIDVDRNAYGSQLSSFETNIKCEINKKNITIDNAIFIRAPKIIKTGKGVKVLSKYKQAVILANQNNMLVATFHPELTDDPRVHKYFLSLCGKRK